MTDEELIKRLRAYAQIEHAAAPWGFAGEGEVMSRAADRIEALVKENTALKEHVADMLAEQECGCGYDNPTDVCLGHLPLHRKTVARAEQLAATNERLDEAVLALHRYMVSTPYGDQEAVLLSDALRAIEKGRY